ncbi:TlpA family protein disulfide reductase [Shewanella sp. 10N.286.52.A9]|uniref:TlpA family protein disulfide reductase n=1 Tax=Shewanella sp. 10N.286.52.A9 TaxID=3229711 RepID=UPI00354B5E0E
MNKLFATFGVVIACYLPYSQATMPEEKIYSTGENIEKPMIMSRFIEMTHARKVEHVPFTDLSGNEVSLQAHQGNLVIMNLWATWCAPCIKEIPMMDKIRVDNKHRNLVVLPVSIDEEHEKVAAFLTRHQLEGYPTLIDPQQHANKMLPINVVPATYIFDGNGHLVGFLRGYLDWGNKDVQPFIEQLIEKYADPSPLIAIAN